MRYEFECPTCDLIENIYASIHEGPPEVVKCSCCNIKMRHVLGGNFILKGMDWSGKKLTRANEKSLSMEPAEQYVDEQDSATKESQEVLDERRKGTKSFEEYKKHNNQKVERYKKNLKKGIKPK